MFYHFYDNVIYIGAYQHSRKHYIVARVESGKPRTENLFIEQSTLTGFATHYENPISDKEIIRFDEEGQQLALVSLMPMFGTTLQKQDNEWITVREQVGILKAISFIEPEFIQRTAMLSGTQMNVSMKSGESFGTLNNYPQFDFSKFPEKNENWSIENETLLLTLFILHYHHAAIFRIISSWEGPCRSVKLAWYKGCLNIRAYKSNSIAF